MTMGEYKTPGIYIQEKNAFGTSVVEVETAIPAFIGYTEKALNGTEDLTGKPWKITSMAEFINYFGGMNTPKYTISSASPQKNGGKDPGQDPAPNAGDNPTPAPEAGGKSFSVDTFDGSDKRSFTVAVKNDHTLYQHMMLFFANGGGPCYIVSAGNHKGTLEKKVLNDAIAALEKESEPTMLVIPEATNLEKDDCYNLQQAMINHCGDKKQRNRLAILDVFIDRYPADPTKKEDYVANFRNGLSTDYPSYAAAYYPYLATSILSDSDIDGSMITTVGGVKNFMKALGFDDEQVKQLETLMAGSNDDTLGTSLHQALLQNSVAYRQLVKAIKDDLNQLPPSAAIAGVYTRTDNTRGVWKAPANVAVNAVIKPSISITDEDQKDLNAPMNGKAVNAIRTFPGEGVKVWGARTLDGNSQDWRYINVRRTMLFLEQSVKNAARAYVFEPNDANTWMNMRCMIENFLRSVWKRGGLAGSTPEEAYEVHVGLGDTMTGDDILEGILRITVLVAVSHPAEFIEITFQQQMQKS